MLLPEFFKNCWNSTQNTYKSIVFFFSRLIPLQSYFLPKGSTWCVINDFFYLKKKKCSVLKISRFLCFCKIHRFQNLWRSRSCLFFWILSTTTLKLVPILMYCMTNISSMFWLNAGDWKLVSGPFIILLKWQYSKI